MNEFHPSDLARGEPFRESIRYKEPFDVERLDKAHAILSEVLETHGHESVTPENFHEVVEHMRKDSRWHGLHSAGPAFENALRTHLKIEDPGETKH
ncbi:MAG: hypothetical protein AAB442_00155 [Patescibacteria group bacterium]